MLIEIPLGQLAPHPANREFATSGEKWEQFQASIASRGVVAPLLVRPHNGRRQIISGHRRAKAAALAGLETVPCFLREDMGDREVLEWILLDNLEREDLDPVEEARAVRALIEEAGMAPGEVAASLKRSLEWVRTRQYLLDLPEEAIKALKLPKDDTRRLTIGTAELLLDLEAEDRPRAVQMVLHPEFEAVTLNERQAASIIKANITEPKRKQAEWEGKRAKLCEAWRVRLGKLVPKDQRANLMVQALTWEECQAAPAGLAAEDLVPMAERAADAPEDLRWLSLALKYGLRVFLVPDDGQDQSLALVDTRLIRAGEESSAEHNLPTWLVTKARGGVVKESAQLTRAKAAVAGEPEHPEQTTDGPETQTVIEQQMTSRALIDLGPVRRLHARALEEIAEGENFHVSQNPETWMPTWAYGMQFDELRDICEWVIGLKVQGEEESRG
jgi:ParB family chromosome partitioning protein